MNNYEIMMNGNVKIGEFAPEFEAQTTMGNIKLFLILEILPPFVQQSLLLFLK